MNKQSILEVEAEARRLLKRIEAVKAAEKTNSYLWICGSPETAAVRRQSMELTRALSRMRKPL